MKIANLDREIIRNFWTTWEISMKFSGKLCLMIIIKVTKDQCFTLSVDDNFLKNHRGINLTLPSRFRVNFMIYWIWTWKILRLTYCTFIDFIKCRTLLWKTLWLSYWIWIDFMTCETWTWKRLGLGLPYWIWIIFMVDMLDFDLKNTWNVLLDLD